MPELEKENKIVAALEKKFGGKITDLSVTRARRIFAKTLGANAKEIIACMHDELGFSHLATITGLDAGETFDVMYHLDADGILFNLRAQIPAAAPLIATVTDIYPGGEDYERELEDMFGIKIEGLRPGNRYPLPDNWPQGQYPLRKSWKQSALYPQEENKCQK